MTLVTVFGGVRTAGGVGNDSGAELNPAAMAVASRAAHECGRGERTKAAVVWVSLLSVYRFNTEAPYSKEHRTDRPTGVGILGSSAGPWIELWGARRRRRAF